MKHNLITLWVQNSYFDIVCEKNSTVLDIFFSVYKHFKCCFLTIEKLLRIDKI